MNPPDPVSAAPEELWGSIKQGRASRLDWLSENAPIPTIAAVLTALANHQGGVLVMGVMGPTGTLVGVRDADNAIDRALQAAVSIEPPLILPIPRAVLLRDRTVVLVNIPAGLPHIYALEGRYLYRQGTENTALRPRELRRLMMERGETPFESEIALDATMDDLDWTQVKAYASALNAAGDAETVLLKRGCVVRRESELHPTHAGILLFGKDPQAFVRSATITAARFAGESMGDKFNRLDLSGTLPEQIRKAETFLIDHLRKDVQLGKSMARAESFEYPMEAARELVVNAVAHRDYSVTGDEIRLFIFSDHMEVSSPGGLPGPVTVSNIKDERYSRNPVIVQVLSELRFIERLGYGVDRVFDLMHEQQMPPPRFEETAGGLRVTLFSQIETDDSPTQPLTARQIMVPMSSTLKPRLPPMPEFEFVGEVNGIPVNPRQEIALTYLRIRSPRITNSDFQALCPEVHAETIRRDLSDLVAKNLLKKMGEKRGSYYVLNKDKP